MRTGGLQSLGKGDQQSDKREADPEHFGAVQTVHRDEEMSKDGHEDRLDVEEDGGTAGRRQVDPEVKETMLHHQEEAEKQHGSPGADAKGKAPSTNYREQ